MSQIQTRTPAVSSAKPQGRDALAVTGTKTSTEYSREDLARMPWPPSDHPFQNQLKKGTTSEPIMTGCHRCHTDGPSNETKE